MDNNIIQDDNRDYNDNYNGSFKAVTHQKKGHALRNTVIVICVILLLLISSFVTMYILAVQTPNSDKFGATPSNEAIKTLLYSALRDEDAEIPNSDLNSLVAYLLDSDEKARSESGQAASEIKDVAIYVHQNKPSEVFAMVNLGGHTYELSGEFEIDSDIQNNEIKLTFTSCKLGSLPLPPRVILDYVFNNTDLANNTVDIRQDGCDIYIPSEYSFEILEQNITIGITKIQPEDDGLNIKTTSAAEILWNTVEGWLNSLF